MLPVTDAPLIGVHVDGVVVVALLGQTTRDRIRRTTTTLTQVNARVADVVPNDAIERETAPTTTPYRDRSKRQPPDISYQFPDLVVAPHPNNLRPAIWANGNGKAHEPSSEPDGTLVEGAASEPPSNHARRDLPDTDTPAPPPQV